MVLTVYVLALFCTGLAVVPVIKASECATIPEYKTLMDLIQHDNCNSINNMFKLLHDLTVKQHNTDCTKQAISNLAGHFRSHSQMPHFCHCKGQNTYVQYYDLTHEGIPSNHYDCREGDTQDKSYHDLYYEYFISHNHNPGDHPPACRTHHSLWNRLTHVSNDHDLHCLNDLIHHLSYAFEKDGNPCICSDHFKGSVLVPPQCLCNGNNHFLEYLDHSHVGLPSNKIHCREHDTAYHDLFFEFFASTSGHHHPPQCRTHHSIWTRLNAVTNDTHEHCLKDFIYHLSYAFTHNRDPCNCSEKVSVSTTTSPTTSATKTTTTPASIALVITTPATTTNTATSATTTSATTTTTATAATTTSATTTTTATAATTTSATTTTTATAATTTSATTTTTATAATTTSATTIAKTTPTTNSMTTVTTSSFGQCNHTCTLDAVILSKAVENSDAENCSAVRTTKSGPNEALPMVCCNMGDQPSWTQGAQVQKNRVCTDGTPPPYTPIAAYNGTGFLIPDTAGIFYGCIRNGQSGFMMVHQACDQVPQLLHVDGTTGKNPDKYYVIN